MTQNVTKINKTLWLIRIDKIKYFSIKSICTSLSCTFYYTGARSRCQKCRKWISTDQVSTRETHLIRPRWCYNYNISTIQTLMPAEITKARTKKDEFWAREKRSNMEILHKTDRSSDRKTYQVVCSHRHWCTSRGMRSKPFSWRTTAFQLSERQTPSWIFQEYPIIISYNDLFGITRKLLGFFRTQSCESAGQSKDALHFFAFHKKIVQNQNMARDVCWFSAFPWPSPHAFIEITTAVLTLWIPPGMSAKMAPQRRQSFGNITASRETG